jgi:subtilase family serine protease
MKATKVLRTIPSIGLSAVLLSAAFGASASAATAPSHIAPALERLGKFLGPESPSTELKLTVFLNMHNKADLDGRVKEMYTKGSPSFHQWMSVADMKKYAPTPAETEAVKAELASHGLKVLGTDSLGFAVRVSGATSNFEKALGTSINRMSLKGDVFHTTASAPTLGGKAAGLVSHVGGLNSPPMKPMIVRAIDPRTGKPLVGKKIASKGTPNGAYYTSQCFQSPLTLNLSGISADDFTTPETATYGGLGYGGDPTVTTQGDLTPCGYGASDIAKIYGLDKAYSHGIDGTGQTIVIIDSYLQPTAQSNLDLFDSIQGLPPITLTEISAPFGTTFPGIDYGTDVETDLDVQWAHATAPGAAITLLESFSETEDDQQNAIFYAVENHLGNVISLSYGYPEFIESPLTLNIWEEVTELAAASGISFQASTGDNGDQTDYGYPASVNAPADSPYATAVGGTSVALINGSPVTTGWGNNIDFLSFSDGTTTYIEDPTFGYFYAGSGGGASGYFPKPGYQAALPGATRLLPDVSALADPFTGAETVYDDGVGDQFIAPYGGTSLASPIFTAIWAMADQAVGGSLGQAGPLVSIAPGSWIVDVLPVSGPANVSGSITASGTTTSYSATVLGQPLVNTTTFTDSLWNLGGGEYAVLTFGTDSGLTLTQGWDNVTGYGTPDVGAIVDGVTGFLKQ